MASEIRVDKINSLSGVGTVTLSPTGVDIAGITTAATLRATTGIVTSLTAVSSAKVGSGITLSPDGDIFATGITTVNNQVHIPDYIHHVGDNDCKFGFESGDTFSVETAGTERFQVDSSGNIYIGGVGGSATAGSLWFNDTSANASKIAQSNGNSALTFHTGSSQPERIRIDSSGRLLLGTTTEGHDDADEITISGTRTGITIRSADDNYGNIFFSDATSGTDEYVGAVQYYHADNSLRLKTSSTDRLKILSSGYVNILTGGLTCTDDGAGSGTSNLELQPYGTDGYINCTASGNLYTRMGTGYTIRTRIDSSGNFHINSGNIVMSTSGKGIDFSATGNGPSASSEVLDDYEEGTFTPTYDGTWTNISNSNLRQAKYTRIGNTVHVWMEYFMTGNNGAIANNSNIRGFPFTGTSNPADLYPPANVALMYGPSDYAMDETAAGRAYITIYDDRLYFSMGSKSGIRHIWVQLTYPTNY
jgi:hypothetical protein